MYGGTITGNTVTDGDGGGVMIENHGGRFHLYGGVITNNKAQNGGGVSIVGDGNQHDASTMTGGTISGNTATESGGGVYVHNTVTFTMSGGEIKDNTAGAKGGGICSDLDTYYTQLNINGSAKITGNSAPTGSGVCVNSEKCSVTLSGDVQIKDNLQGSDKSNLYLYGGAAFKIGTLGSKASIGVKTDALAENDAVKIATGATGKDVTGITSDDNTYTIETIGNDLYLVNGSVGDLHTHSIDGSEESKVVWRPISSADELRKITTAGNYYLTTDIVLSSQWKAVNGVNLCLNGKSIKSDAARAILIEYPYTFTLCDCNTENPGAITRNDSANTGRGVYMNGGTFNMYGGAISGNNMPDLGGGVYIGAGTFNMYGGSISGNTSSSNGGGVYVSKGTEFNMTGGTINGNTALTGAQGGGVYTEGTFNMSGGTIQNNTVNSGVVTGSGGAPRSGGGVYVAGGTFTMSSNDNGNAAIINNTVDCGYGGGVFLTGGTFTMSGDAAITGNTANSSDNTVTYSDGGGVYVSSGTFTMSGNAAITGNTSKGGQNVLDSYRGGGVFLYGGTMNVSGTVNITGNIQENTYRNTTNPNNVYLPNGNTITIPVGSTLDDGAKINVSTAKAPTASAPIKIATGWSGDNFSTIFTPDVDDYSITLGTEEGSLYLSTCQHSWNYTANGATITAKCSNCNADGGSVTISASDAPYDRSAKTATVTATNWQGPNISITYKQGDVVLITEPINAGKYTASITLGEGTAAVTASVDYEITKVAPKVSSWMSYIYQLPTYNGEPVSNPTEEKLPMRFGSFSDITGFNWYKATSTNDGYVKGDELSGPPTNAGDYYIEAVFKEGTNTTAGIEGTGLTIKPQTGFTAQKSCTAYANRAYTYTFNVADFLDDLTLGSNVSYSLSAKNTGDYYFEGGMAAITLTSDGILTLPIKSVSKPEPTGGFGSLTIWVTSSNYNWITLTLSLQMTDKQEKDLAVKMDDWTYGDKGNDPQYTQPAGSTVSISYTKKADGTLLTEKPTDAGSYTVTVKCETDDTIYTGTKGFIISPKSISGAVVTLDNTKYTYDGSAKEPGVTSVVLDGKTLTDYTVSYEDNTNAGTATVKVTGKGNYAGTAEATFVIDPAQLTIIDADVASKTYDGTTAATVNSVTFDGLVNGEALTENDYRITDAQFNSANVSDAKKVTVTVALQDTETAKNYKLTSATYDKAATMGKATVKADPVERSFTVINGVTFKETLDLNKLLPTLSGCSYGSVSYVAGVNMSDSEYSCSAAVTEGTLTLTITPSANAKTNGSIGTVTVTVQSENYENFDMTFTFSAQDKIIPTGAPTLSTSNITYGDTLDTIALSGVLHDDINHTDVAGTFAWTDGTIKPDAGDYQAQWTFTPDNGNKYQEITGTATITVAQAKPTGEPKYTPITASGKTLEDAQLTLTDSTLNPAAGTLEWVDEAGNVLPDTTIVEANKTYQWRFTPADANYAPITGSAELYHVGSSGGGGGSGTPTYPVSTPSSVDSGSVSSSVKRAASGSTVTITVKPDSGYQLKDLTVTDSKGNTLKLTDKGDGKYTFVMPSSQVDVKATFTQTADENSPYDDVSKDDYFYDAVKWAKDNGITGGVGGGLFGSGDGCTRAQIVTFLWRTAGSPEPKGTSSFSDVPADAYYAKAVAWAVENGITAGTSVDKFSPDATCTRAHGVTFLYRTAGSPAVTGTPTFRDVAADAYYAKPVKWATDNGITSGIGGGLFGPDNRCTRAQIVTFLWKLHAGK